MKKDKKDKINKLITQVEKHSARWENDIYKIMDLLDYKESSRFSFNIDRLERFVNELKQFKL